MFLSVFAVKTCEEAIEEFFNTKLYVIGYVGIGIAGVMVSMGREAGREERSRLVG